MGLFFCFGYLIVLFVGYILAGIIGSLITLTQLCESRSEGTFAANALRLLASLGFFLNAFFLTTYQPAGWGDGGASCSGSPGLAPLSVLVIIFQVMIFAHCGLLQARKPVNSR